MCEIEDDLRDYARSIDRRVFANRNQGIEGVRLLQRVEAAGINPLHYDLIDRLMPDLQEFGKEEVDEFVRTLDPELQAAYNYWKESHP